MLSIKVFASHDWGVNGCNHNRVRQVVTSLRERGIDVWFDETNMKGNILESMCNGIDQSDLVLVFVTKNYINKVKGKNANDNVKREFMYASQSPNKMLPICFEDGLAWSGPVGMLLGNELYEDLRIINDASLQNLVKRIQTATLLKTASKDVHLKCAYRPAPKLHPKRTPPPICEPLNKLPPLTVKQRIFRLRDVYGASTSDEKSKDILLRIFDSIHAKSRDHYTFAQRLEITEAELGL